MAAAGLLTVDVAGAGASEAAATGPVRDEGAGAGAKKGSAAAAGTETAGASAGACDCKGGQIPHQAACMRATCNTHKGHVCHGLRLVRPSLTPCCCWGLCHSIL